MYESEVSSDWIKEIVALQVDDEDPYLATKPHPVRPVKREAIRLVAIRRVER